MGYVLKAVLSSAQHPEYGQITVPFPIPDEKYDRMIELLEPLEIGDALRQDCRVDELDSFYTVLNRLVGSLVNFDELDYLAKRLDSFDDGEAAQFQGMACKLGVSNIKDFINLTFCCQQATVITDFSDLDAIGRQHYMTMQGGGCRIEELERLDGRKFALDLILNHLEGRITPYGVVYDNGMKLEQLYDGRHFPCYHYQPNLLAVGLSSRQEPENTDQITWLLLPCSEQQLQRGIARSGVNIHDARIWYEDSLLPSEVEEVLEGQREDLFALNDMATAIAALSDLEQKKLTAVMEMAKPECAGEIRELAKNLELFEFAPKVRTPAEYGRYMIQDSGHYEYDPNLEEFYDYERYGKLRMEKETGAFTEKGYVLLWHIDIGGADGRRSGRAAPAGTGISDGRNVTMILLTLSRGKGEETVRLQLPASPAEIGETFAFLDRISLDTTATAILDVSSNVPVLYRCLYDVDVEDSEQFQKLQKLAERTEALSPAKAAIFSGALDAECVWNLEGALTVADRLDEYMLVNNVSSDSELGIYLVNKGITPFPDRFKPYINYARVGAEYREKHGGEYSSGNYVQKKTPELLENERLDGVFRIWMENPCPVRVQSETAQITLPATFEQLESARQLLGVDSLNMAKLTRVEALRPYLGEYLPLQGMDLRLEQLDELAENIRIMDQEDGALLKYLSVLEVEQPATLQEALRFSIELDDYERVPDDPEEYGKQVLERIGADEELISTLDGFTDFEAMGNFYMREDGVRRTEFGLLRKLSDPFPEVQDGLQMH